MNFLDKISDKIRHIRSGPESVKIRYIWVLAVVIFVAIVAVWLVFAKINVPSIGSGAIDEKNDPLKERIKSNYDNLKNNALPDIKEMLKDKDDANKASVTPMPTSVPASVITPVQEGKIIRN